MAETPTIPNEAETRAHFTLRAFAPSRETLKQRHQAQNDGFYLTRSRDDTKDQRYVKVEVRYA
jgi:hypothetical protein